MYLLLYNVSQTYQSGLTDLIQICFKSVLDAFTPAFLSY